MAKIREIINVINPGTDALVIINSEMYGDFKKESTRKHIVNFSGLKST